MELVDKKYKIRALITDFAKKLGFDLVGFSKAGIDRKNITAYKTWLREGFNAEMSYLSEKEKIEKRERMVKIMTGARSAVVLGMNYYRPQKPLKKGFGRIARYAYGRDYHKIIWGKLAKLEKFIREIDKENFHNKTIDTKSYIDTGPILERAYAVSAGLGVIGKNGNLITKEFGSWVFLAEIITDIDLVGKNIIKTKAPFSACGKCERCIHACPTKAIIAPGVIDARKCIAYLTIENKGEIPRTHARKIGEVKRIFGCDICQEVCPHNFSREKPTTHKELIEPAIAGDQLELKKILKIKTDEEFVNIFAGSALMRAKKEGLIRNAKAAQ